jgi:glyoxylase-like metal-dependent hydrolase (beta-lactamase superfamily II)/rhodanese-related sulfurtransferase
MTIAEVQTSAPAISAARLYATLLDGDAPFILDVRNPHDFARWRVEGRAGLAVANIPYYDFIEDEDMTTAQVPAEGPVLVVCAKEGASQYVATLLRERGVEASYLAGGILSWGHLYDIRNVVSAPWGRIVQVARPARGDLSFLLISDGQAALIDPLRHIEQYTQAIADAGARLTHIFDTHVHADHISGGPRLSELTGAPYHVHPYDAIHPIDMLPARIAYTPLADRQRYTVGQVTLEVIWYPGHTLGQVNFLATAPDGARYLFTGDGIFLHSFGRPDLGGRGEAWTPMLYESMYRRLPQHLTDGTIILPAHFSTLDEDAGGGIFATSWGEVRHTNESLRHGQSLEAFSAFVLGNLPNFPPQYVEIKRVNIGLVEQTEEQAEELELGKNICALAK